MRLMHILWVFALLLERNLFGNCITRNNKLENYFIIFAWQILLCLCFLFLNEIIIIFIIIYLVSVESFKFTTIWYHNIMHGCAILIFGQLPFDNITTNVLLFSWWALKNKLVNDILVSYIHILQVFHILFVYICQLTCPISS